MNPVPQAAGSKPSEEEALAAPAGTPGTLAVELIAALRRGDAEAGRAVTAAYRPAIVRFCRGYLNSPDDAEDAAQDVFFKMLASKDVPDHFRAWLYRIARNHCLNLVRNRHRRKDQGVMPEPDGVDADLTGQLTRLLRVELGSRVKEVLAKLPHDTSEALRMRYVEGLSRAEIAQVLALRESVVKSRLFEGLKSIRSKLAETPSVDR